MLVFRNLTWLKRNFLIRTKHCNAKLEMFTVAPNFKKGTATDYTPFLLILMKQNMVKLFPKYQFKKLCLNSIK